MAPVHWPKPNPIRSCFRPIFVLLIPSQIYKQLMRMISMKSLNAYSVVISTDTYPVSRVIEQPDKNKCFKSQVCRRINVWCVNRAQPLRSRSFNLELAQRMRHKNSSLISRDSSASDATDNSSSSRKPGGSLFYPPPKKNEQNWSNWKCKNEMQIFKDMKRIKYFVINFRHNSSINCWWRSKRYLRICYSQYFEFRTAILKLLNVKDTMRCC